MSYLQDFQSLSIMSSVTGESERETVHVAFLTLRELETQHPYKTHVKNHFFFPSYSLHRNDLSVEKSPMWRSTRLSQNSRT